jgi:siroheme synthase (precorrin-2 oxidase/ferrochelatase)
MARKLTLTIDDAVYEGLYRTVGPRRISRFLEALARPHVVQEDLESAYRAMAADEQREAEAAEWSENLVGDVADETR